MAPHPDGSASRTFIRFDPIKIAALIEYILEFCTNEKYHSYVFIWPKNPASFGGIGWLAIPPFSNKKSPLTGSHLI